MDVPFRSSASIAVVVTAAVLGMAGCDGGDAPPETATDRLPPHAVAVVGATEITRSDLDRRIAALGRSPAAGSGSPSRSEQRALATLLHEVALEQEARRRGASAKELARRPERTRRALSRWRARTICSDRYATACGGSGDRRKTTVNGFVGEAPGQVGGQFTEPVDVAVYGGRRDDPDDDKVLVLEGLAGNSRVQRLDADGNFELAWGKDTLRPGAPGDTGAGHEICRRAPDCKAAPSGNGRGELDRPTGLAVDPATGDVYVADRGNRRVEVFDREGQPLDSWPLELSSTAGDPGRLAIAVAPSRPHDVFIGEQRGNRVLQLDAHGELERAWGWGVASGSNSFESCSDDCRPGRPVGGDAKGWPSQLAVDADRVVYGSAFYGAIFSGAQARRTWIVRFRAAPTDEDRTEALLDPLKPLPYAYDPRDLTKRVTNGTTLGLDVDAGGELLAINNPFGTSKIDFVSRLEADGEARAPRVEVADTLPFLQNVTGIAAAEGGVALLSSGTLEQRTGTSTFTGCARPDARRDCHGLIALAVGGRPDALMTGRSGVVGTIPGALIAPKGVASYEFQASRDGRAWKPLAPQRYIAGTSYEWVPAPLTGNAADQPHWIRVAVTKRTEDGVTAVVSQRTSVP